MSERRSQSPQPPPLTLAHEVWLIHSKIMKEIELEIVLGDILDVDIELYEDKDTAEIFASDAMNESVLKELLDFIAEFVKSGSYINITNPFTHELYKLTFHDGQAFEKHPKFVWSDEEPIHITKEEDDYESASRNSL